MSYFVGLYPSKVGHFFWDTVYILDKPELKSKFQVPITSQPESQIQIGVWIWPVNYYLSNEHAFEYHDFTTKNTGYNILSC